MMIYENMGDLFHELSKQVAKQTESMILEQLGYLIHKKLIVIESGQPVIVRDEASDKLVVHTFVKLKLRDQEVFQELEEQNNKLREALAEFANIKSYVKHITRDESMSAKREET